MVFALTSWARTSIDTGFTVWKAVGTLETGQSEYLKVDDLSGNVTSVSYC